MAINWFRSRKAPGASASLYEKKLAKINLRIEKLALKGKDNYIEYYKLVDELIQKGDYNAFEQCIYYYYGIEINDAPDINSIKKSTWNEISFQMTTPFLKKLKLIYDKNQVYQTSYDIYSLKDDFLQIGLSNPLSPTFSNTNYNQSFILERVGDIVYMNVVDNNLSYVSIERAEWVMTDGIYTPTNKSYLQDFFVGTHSNQKNPNTPIQLEIPTTVVRDYVIYTEEKQNILNGYTYSNSLTSSTSTCSISWQTDPTATGYVLNISTFSSFEKTVPEYTSKRIGTVSSTDYIVSGNTASLLVFDLQSKINHYFRIRKTLSSTYINSVSITGTTASFAWPAYLAAEDYSLDVSTNSSFSYIIPGCSLTLGTISTTASYTTGAINRYLINGLTAGVYHYKVRALYGVTQSGSFTSSQSIGLTSWPISNIATNYKFEISKSSTFSSIYQSIKLGTQSDSYLTISGNTASFIVNDLDSNDTYYYRVMIYKGYHRFLNYKVLLTKDSYLGQIKEVEIYTPDAQYLVQNKQYSRLVGARKTYLEVYKRDSAMSSGFATASIFAYDNFSYTEEANLLIRYTQAVNYLNS